MPISADHINPFITAATKILKDVCQIDVVMGKPYVKPTNFTEDSTIIMIGVTGEMKGQVLIDLGNEVACDIASRMTMMTITELDELATSAICELGNMILGHAATIFSNKGVGIDITPPTMCKGNMKISTAYSANICVPLGYDNDKKIDVNVSII